MDHQNKTLLMNLCHRPSGNNSATTRQHNPPADDPHAVCASLRLLQVLQLLLRFQQSCLENRRALEPSARARQPSSSRPAALSLDSEDCSTNGNGRGAKMCFSSCGCYSCGVAPKRMGVRNETLSTCTPLEAKNFTSKQGRLLLVSFPTQQNCRHFFDIVEHDT